MIPRSSASGADRLAETYLDAPPNWIGDDGRCTRPSSRPTRPPAASPDQPEPAEHPDPDRDRPRDACFCRARTSAPSTTTRSSAGSWPTSPTSRCCATSSCAARMSTPRPPRCSSSRPTSSTSACAPRPDGQLRHRLRPQSPRPGRPPADPRRRRGVHRPLPRALPRRRAVHEGRRRAGQGARLRLHAPGAPRQIPEIRARNWQARELGERLAVNTVIQGTAADIIKIAMVARTTRCAEG